MGKVLGFVGWPCSGKDEAAGYLEGVHGAQRFGHSDFIRAYAESLDIQIRHTSELSALFEERAAVEGYGWIAQQVSEVILELWCQAPRKLVVVSGVRNLAEVKIYNELTRFHLVKLEANFEVRYRRWRERPRPGEQMITRQEAIAIQNLPGNANIPQLMGMPGPTIVNENDKPAFYHALDQLVVRLR